MNSVTFDFAGHTFQALGSGALFWPEQSLLVVSDLHLGKSARIARRGGQMLPPYETHDTLRRLSDDIIATAPRTVLSLGDSFDDDLASAELPCALKDMILNLQAARSWIWVTGNHDPQPSGLGAQTLEEYQAARLTFRHESRPGEINGEISGHFHPKIRLNLGGRMLSRPCFLFDDSRLILPSYGTYTGGLRCDDPVLKSLFTGSRYAILTGDHPAIVPADQQPKRQRGWRAHRAGSRS